MDDNGARSSVFSILRTWGVAMLRPYKEPQAQDAWGYLSGREYANL